MTVLVPYLLLCTKATWRRAFSPWFKDHIEPQLSTAFTERKRDCLFPSLSLILPPPTLRTPSFQFFQCNVQLQGSSRKLLPLCGGTSLAAACTFLEKDSNHFKELKSSNYIKAGCYMIRIQSCEWTACFKCAHEKKSPELLFLITFKLH